MAQSGTCSVSFTSFVRQALPTIRFVFAWNFSRKYRRERRTRQDLNVSARTRFPSRAWRAHGDYTRLHAVSPGRVFAASRAISPPRECRMHCHRVCGSITVASRASGPNGDRTIFSRRPSAKTPLVLFFFTTRNNPDDMSMRKECWVSLQGMRIIFVSSRIAKRVGIVVGEGVIIVRLRTRFGQTANRRVGKTKKKNRIFRHVTP